MAWLQSWDLMALSAELGCTMPLI